MKQIIQVEKLSKTYKLGSGLRRRGKIHALKEVSFSINPGEIVGIVGPNGAGKSTLLRILSRITEPDFGTVRIRGRISSLLDVAAGFNAELTGRENIFFSGAILGMTRMEIKEKIDSIASMAGIKDFLDTPLKRYSTGMILRLGVSINAHLEADLMLVDEALAAADGQFQQLSLKVLRQIANDGGAVILVSHQLDIISQLCPRTIVINSGQIVEDGPTSSVLERYRGLLEV